MPLCYPDGVVRDDQPRWPRGTPVAPTGKGPGGGRFRSEPGGWAAQAAEAIVTGPRARYRPSDMHTQERIEAAFAYRDSETGIRVEISSVRPSPGGQTYVYGNIYGRGDQLAGEVVWTIRDPRQSSVELGGIALMPGHQGQGFGTRYMEQAERVMRETGIKYLTLNANIDVGGYSWARAGFDFANPSARAAALVHAATRVWPGMDQAARDKLNELLRRPPDGPDAVAPIELAMIGWQPGLSTWPGKRLMLGSMWLARKTL